ncbi:hypothetical protein [Streptomyces sp. WAC06614]|uniref:hypothetical protein n=1 Tax=Streptomyces sp. WAC06614 TaxID=2487416 RepID=UPI000F7A407B|nr:hypothetical protein [Streptomyces sp. WAC06614]RSS83908.1 hypothetical protein EF918_02230 [Streptomyces sp. WAC06614]
MFQPTGRAGRSVVALGVFAAGLGLAAAGLAAPRAEAATRGCRGELAHTLALPDGEMRIYRTRTQACAVTVSHHPGTRDHLAVSIQPRGGVPVREAGRFTHFAGPVTVHTVSRCVYARGEIGREAVASGWILC